MPMLSSDAQSRRTITFRWLGVAGIELQMDDSILLIDPYVTRIPFRKLWLGRVQPNGALVREKIPRADFVLVTHAHFDHLLDVPEVVRHTGATAYGSSNACRLLAACGVQENRIAEIQAGDRLPLGPFAVQVLTAEHVPVAGFGPAPLPKPSSPPVRARDYRMDVCFAFLLSSGRLRVLTDPGEHPGVVPPADLLFLYPYQDRTYLEALLSQARPRMVLPLHWDDPFRPVSRPPRPYFQPPRLALPPLRRINLAEFARQVQEIAPQAVVLIPERFRPYQFSLSGEPVGKR
jgi:L-ascorbate metabolism protein UlaG (beta-lactamase superfamily)